MKGKTVDLNRFLAQCPQAVLERTLIAEHLLSKGYLMSDLSALPLSVVRSLMREACQFASLRLAEIECKDIFLQKIRLPISLN